MRFRIRGVHVNRDKCDVPVSEDDGGHVDGSCVVCQSGHGRRGGSSWYHFEMPCAVVVMVRGREMHRLILAVQMEDL